MTHFNQFQLPEFLLTSLERMNISMPTPIQEEAIPLGLEGKDILASAQTGSGKTIAYLLPILTKLFNDPQGKALVLAPTRELAVQVKDTIIQLLGRGSPLHSALLIGGEPISKQFDQLRKSPRIIIGTPGRINDHLNRRTVDIRDTSFFVLDETDRMLDMGFSDQLEEIKRYLPQGCQTFMFSATMPSNILKLAQKYLNDPQRIAVGSTTKPVTQIQQDIIHTTAGDKFSHLLKELDKREGSVIVFVKTKRSAEDIADRLKDENHNAQAMHGDLQQRKRERVMKSFRDSKSRIMVATDIAARGLDVPHIKHVVNYDLPQSPEDYVHRIGRTGRAGAEGFALSLISPQDARQWKIIHRHMYEGEDSKPSSYGRMPSNKNRTSSRGDDFKGSSRPFSPKKRMYEGDDSRPASSGRGAFPKSRYEGNDSRPASTGRGAFPKPRYEKDDSIPASTGRGAFPKPRYEKDDSRPASTGRGAFPKSRYEGDDSRPASSGRGAFPKSRYEKDDSRPSSSSRGAFPKPRYEKDDSRSASAGRGATKRPKKRY
jgi:superfamily II DNA/RNA helicase